MHAAKRGRHNIFHWSSVGIMRATGMLSVERNICNISMNHGIKGFAWDFSSFSPQGVENPLARTRHMQTWIPLTLFLIFPPLPPPEKKHGEREGGLSVELSRETASAKFMAGGSVGKTSQNYTRTHTHLRGQPPHTHTNAAFAACAQTNAAQYSLQTNKQYSTCRIIECDPSCAAALQIPSPCACLLA